jgi:hypothetical protein
MTNDSAQLHAMAANRTLLVQEQVFKIWTRDLARPLDKLFPTLEQAFRPLEEARFASARKKFESGAFRLFSQGFFGKASPPATRARLFRYLSEFCRSAALSSFDMMDWYAAKWALYTRGTRESELNLFPNPLLEKIP